MSLNRSRSRSIASRLVWTFTFSAALLLLVGLGALYWIVVQHTREEDNAFLLDKTRAITAYGSDVGREFAQEHSPASTAGEPASYLIRVIDPQGRMISESQGMGALLPSAVFVNAPSASPRELHSNDKWFSLLKIDVRSTEGSFRVEIAQDRTEDAKFMKQFAILLGGVLVTGSIAAAMIAVIVTRRGLRPLAEMTAAVSQIGPTQLHERVAPTGWPGELMPLALAFDQSLDRLEDSFRRLSQFSADLAHELRTPVANMRGEAEVTLTRSRTNEEYISVIESNVTECEKLSGVIDGLLFVARADAAEQQIQPLLFDGRVALDKIAAYYETVAEERHIEIICEGRGEVYGDRGMFERAVGNLVDNSLRYVGEGGKIELALSVTRDETIVTVSDNGAGIEREHLPRVFDRFYRVDPARTASGSGLGLSLVKSIVALHGGTSDIQSEPGKGTRVVLRFPSTDKSRK